MTIERKEEIAAILVEDAELLKVLAGKSPEEVVAALKEKNFDCSVDEIKEIGEWIKETIQKCTSEDGELNEEALNDVVGGAKGDVAKLALVAVGLTVAFYLCGW